MAEAYGKLTGKPGICLVTRGPGATNASIGVHTAFQDSTPMILLIGQVGTDFMEREAFQEIDYRRMFGPMSKWVAQIDRTDRIPEFIARAYQVATSGRMGPVVLALPEDVQSGTAAVADARPWQRVESAPSPEALGKLSPNARRSAAAASCWWAAAAGIEASCAQLQRFAETQHIAVGCEFRSQDLFDNAHANHAGDVGIGINPKLAERVKASDLRDRARRATGRDHDQRLRLDCRPRRRHSGSCTSIRRPTSSGVSITPIVMINATMPAMARAGGTTQGHARNRKRRSWRPTQITRRGKYARKSPGKVQMWMIQHMDRVLPPDVIITNGAGNYTTWAHRFHRYRGFRTQLAPASGAMGVWRGPPASRRKALYPNRTVISLAGDGCFFTTGQELATAVQYQLNVVIIVVNNNMYGTIRMHQEREYPARVYGTPLVNPDFRAFAAAFGAHGELVETTEQFGPALERALNAGKPALIEVRIDPEAITPNATLQSIRNAAQK